MYFSQATAKINILRKNFAELETIDREKIEKLKKQYFDHKKLWETVRFADKLFTF